MSEKSGDGRMPLVPQTGSSPHLLSRALPATARNDGAAADRERCVVLYCAVFRCAFVCAAEGEAEEGEKSAEGDERGKV